MGEDIFDKFVSPQNLKVAFGYVKNEIKNSSLPLDPIWIPGISAVDVLGDAFFNSLSRILVEGIYEPDDAHFFVQHKDNFGMRKVAMLSIVDRVIYQAIFNQDILGRELEVKFTSKNYYPRLSTQNNIYLQGYKPFYGDFVSNQLQATSKGFVWRGEFDIFAYYDNIDHEILFKKLEDAKIGSIRIIQILKKMLKNWHRGNRGIPQGPDASSLVANFYLTSVDNFFIELHREDIRCLRYMDDIVLLSSSEKSLYKGIEILTEELIKLDLNLNSKSGIEVVSEGWYEGLVFLSPYGSFEEQMTDGVLEQIKLHIPDIIRRLSNKEGRRLVSHRDFSRLKYYLKSDRTYEFAEEIIMLYPHLPSIADVICKYLIPISSSERIRFLMFKVFAEHYLLRWQRFWLAKFLLLEDLKRRHLMGIDFCKDEAWEIRAISNFVKWSREPNMFNFQVMKNAYDSSESEFENNLYLSFVGRLGNDPKVKKFLNQVLKNASLEGKIILYSQILSKTNISEISSKRDLFSLEERQPELGIKRNELSIIAAEKLKNTLGFFLDLSSSNEMVLELISDNNELVLTGRLLGGLYLSASNTNNSRLVRLLIALCTAHKKQDKERTVFGEFYPDKLIDLFPRLKSAKVENINLAREKVDRLTPLLAETIDYFVESAYVNGTFYRFRRAINSELFQKIPEFRQEKMARYASQMRVKPVKD